MRPTRCSPAGRELLDRLRGQEVTPGHALRWRQRLRGSYPAELIAAALTQQSLRMQRRAKFSRADEMLFTRAGLEQASSELAAGHSAARLRGSPSSPTCAAASAATWPRSPSRGRVLAVELT